MKDVKEINSGLFCIISEPGDATRYHYIMYADYNDYSFMPIRNSFRYPQRLNWYDVKNLVSDVNGKFSQEMFDIAEKENCNPYTLSECIRSIVAHRKGELK